MLPLHRGWPRRRAAKAAELTYEEERGETGKRDSEHAHFQIQGVHCEEDAEYGEADHHRPDDRISRMNLHICLLREAPRGWWIY
jgi:hypothetical protein